jgi:transposase
MRSTTSNVVLMACSRCEADRSLPLLHFLKNHTHERHLHLGIKIKEIIPVALTLLINESLQFPLQGIPIVFEALKNLPQFLTHFSGVGGILIREPVDVVPSGVLHVRGARTTAALRLQHHLELRIGDCSGRNLWIDAAHQDVRVNERVHFSATPKRFSAGSRYRLAATLLMSLSSFASRKTSPVGLRSDHVTGTSYALVGHTPVIRATRQRFGCNMIWAITNKGALASMVFQDKFKASVFAEFMKRLLKKIDSRIHLIVDGHLVHRSGAATRFAAIHSSRLRLMRMPGYCPELNPDELLSQEVKTNGFGKSRPANRTKLMAAVRSHLYRRQKQPQVITDAFREQHVRYAACALRTI